MKEYNHAHAAFYDDYATGLEGDVQFYVEEAQKAGAPILELGCGTGRILIPIAEAGMTIVGLDCAQAMLSIAKQKVSKLSAETQRRIELIEGDMRNFSLGRRFKLVIIPYRAFLHLSTPTDQRQTLGCIREHLADDGHLIFNIFDPSLETIATQLSRIGRAMKKDSEFIDSSTGHRIVIWKTHQHDPEQQRLDAYIIFEALNDEGQVISKTYTPLRLRYVYRYEMEYLLELCGYQIEALYGDFQRGPFRHGGEQIWVVRRS